MMRREGLVAGVAAIALGGALAAGLSTGLASAQQAPESLLPPGFDDPAPTPTPAPRPTAAPTPVPAAPGAVPTGPLPPPVPGTPADLPAAPQLSEEELSRLPSLEELEELSTDQLDDLLGLKPKFDIPPAARRSMARVGLISTDEGGLPSQALARQPAKLVRAILKGTKGPLVSRWGHIMMRRALASRLAAPRGMNPAEFVALRAQVLNSMGEFAVARGLVQDVDAGNWSPAMTTEALKAYIATSDIVGACPAVRLQGSAREDAQWDMLQAICNAYAGEGALAASQLNAAQNREIAPEIDLLLAQRFAGAAGRGRGGTTVSWDGVEELTPWRFALANALGEEIPAGLIEDAIAGPRADYYAMAGATAPMLPLDVRAGYAELAASRGILSASAMVDLYSQIYAEPTIGGEFSDRAARLREAYLGVEPDSRITAMRGLWGEGTIGFSGQILTAFAAARIPPAADQADDAGELIASMLTAGLDKDAAAWAGTVEAGSLGWALIALADPDAGRVEDDALNAFVASDDSEEERKSAFLVAALAGLGRLPVNAADGYGVDLSRQTRWTRIIDRAAEVENPVMVALLAGLGMQGQSWSQMTPLHLYYLTSSLRRVGMEAEARMIAAEAVARG
ncbi:hypothetical protein [Erythrobacter aurantius]|uniref:hypothetical protein n=1 Tax=Erythrobacter aurantius TaxID=2909249 RepID=UPI0020792C44|nr:hypothetical protein [Erythrobacter aurantius]